MNKTICLSFIAILLGFLSNAQPICGFDKIHERLLKTDSTYARLIDRNDLYLSNYAKNAPKYKPAGVLYTIPVVVHVVHTGGNPGSIYNPTDEQIIATINYLNKIYNGTEPSLTGGVGDMQIQFALAKRDPNCNPTSGINHVNGSSIPGYTANGINRSQSNGATEISVKDFIRWDPAKYYNIWVVNKIDGADGTSGQFVAGFAYFPGTSSSYDGTVMLATQMEEGDKTLPHEIGHALNLYHTFNGSSVSTSCPSNNNCSTGGDRVCDTDPVAMNSNSSGVIDFSCRTGTNPCTNTPYSINTESNVMGYSNCFTLFTAGQKTRALAAMTLFSRASLATSLGATPTNDLVNPCQPKINFELLQSNVPETGNTLSDCKNYRDYNFNMTISSNPSATATASLQISGTATNGNDYIITTNGDFTTTTNIVTFPTGSSTNQPFTIRIFDDGASEPQETIVLGFTINNGGGNAVKGNAATSLTINISDNDLIATDTATGLFSTGVNNYSLEQPFRGAYAKARTQMIFLASELRDKGMAAGAIISQLSLYVNSKGSTAPYTGFTIKLKNTSSVAIPDASFETVANTVFSNDYSTVAGLNTITFTTPFTWNGTSNLMVEFCYNNSASTANDIVNSSIVGSRLSAWNRTSSGTGCTLSPGYGNISGVGYVRPDITFTASLVTATALNAADTIYVGPLSDNYFTSNNKLIARVKNTSNVDYGCTSITIDRAGSAAVAFQNMDTAAALMNKTFIIKPTNNTTTGNVELTLYYTTNEINGWQNSTGQNFNNIQIFKSDSAIQLATVLNPAGAGNTDSLTTIIKTFGTGKSLTTTITNLSGGFGAGVFSTPVTIYSFTGNGNWSDSTNWVNNIIPPAILLQGSQIIIDPIAGGECVLDVAQRISQGASIIIMANKNFRIAGDLEISNQQ